MHVAFVDVLGPTPSEVLARMPDEPVTLVPAFLSRGYHVTSNIPEHVQASGHPDVTVTEALGPGPQLVRVLADRLIESGWRRDDSVVLAAAGTSDPGAQRDLHTMATWLSATTSSRVELAFAATGTPRVADAVDASAATRGSPRRGGVVFVGGRLVSRPAAGQRRRRRDRTARHTFRPGAADRRRIPPRSVPVAASLPLTSTADLDVAVHDPRREHRQ